MRNVFHCLFTAICLLLVSVDFGYAQNLGKNIVTNGDFGKLPSGASATSYRQQSSIVGNDREEEGFGSMSYLSGGNFSTDGGNKYIISNRTQPFGPKDWWGDYRDDDDPDGLMLVIEAKYTGDLYFYSRKFSKLNPEMWYYFSAKAMNVFQKNYITLTWLWDPQVQVFHNGTQKGSTERLSYGTGSWGTVNCSVQIGQEGVAEMNFRVARYGSGGGWYGGCDVALDDIVFCPYLLTPGQITLDGCQIMAAGSVTLNSSVSGGPTGNETKYGRWMRRDKGGDWQWIGVPADIQSSGYALVQDSAAFRNSDYRILYSFSKSLLSSLTTPPTALSDEYAFSEVFEGRGLPGLSPGAPSVLCKAGTLLNVATVQVSYPAGVSEISWQIDNGTVNTTACPAGQASVEVSFEFDGSAQAFQIVSYKVPAFCQGALPLAGLTFPLKTLYIPNTVSDDINARDLFLCHGETGTLEAELARKTIQNPVFYWYGNKQLSGEPIAKTARIPVPELAEGEHRYYVTIKATNRCLSVPETAREVIVRVNPFALAHEISVAGDAAVCEKVPLSLTAAAAEGTGISNPLFEWYRSADFVPAALLGSGAFYAGDSLVSGEHRLFVRMKGDNRCFNTAGNGKEVVVWVDPRAVAGDIAVEGDSRICLADPLRLTAGLAAGKNVSDPVFRWYRDANLTELETGVSEGGKTLALSGLLAGQHGWYVTLAGNGLCENLPGKALLVPVVVQDSFALPVIPVDTVRIFRDDDAVVSLDIPSASELQYEWYAASDLSGGLLGREKSVTVSGLAEGVHTFYVRMKDVANCRISPVGNTVRVYPPTNIRVDDIALCQGNSGMLSVKTTLTDLVIAWSNREDISNVLGTERNLQIPEGLSVGDHTYYVRVTDNTNGLTLQQAVKVTVVPRAAVAGSAFEGKTMLCVGNDLKIPFASLTGAVRYKVSLKSSSLENFEFPEYSAPVTPEIIAAGKLPVALPDFVIPAEMNGGDFVLSVELTGQSVNMGGKVETCSTVADFAFAVQKLPEISVDEPAIVCSGGNQALTAAIELNGNGLAGTEWWVAKESGDELLSSDLVLNLSGLTKEWNGRQVWLRLQTGCGWTESNRVTLRVFDNSFNTISYSGGDIYPGMMAKVEGSIVPLNGLFYSWEYKTFFGGWTKLEGMNTASAYIPVEVAGSFRRTVTAGECSGVSNEAEVKIADFADSTGMDEGLGRYVYQETFGYVSQFDWVKENGDKRDITTYRKFDHTGGINLSKYTVHNYEMKSEDEWEESVNDINRLPEKNPLLFYSGDWVFQQTSTNAISEPWTKYKNNPAYVWCTDNILIYNSRTDYVENGTYCSGNLTVTQPARWFNVNGSWKMGYWFRYFYTGKSPGMGDGKYALTPCAYQLDPGAAFVKYSKNPDHTVDPSGETGLMLAVNCADNDVVYSRTVSGLTGGMWYCLSAYVANPEAGGLNSQPNVKLAVTGKGITGENGMADPSAVSGSLGRGDDLNWTRCTLNFFVPEGVNQVKFSISNTNGAGAGNVFVLDDITIRELLVKNWDLAENFCSQPGDVKFTLANEAKLPDYAVAYSRLMKKQKGSDRWEWATQVSDSMKLVGASELAVDHDFRVVEAFSASLLDRIDPNDLAATNALGYYAVTEKYDVPEFCLSLNGFQVDYTVVPDSVKIIPDLSGTPAGAEICSRFLFRRFGSDRWEWYGKAGKAETNYISWIDMLEGDYRVVYGFSDRLLERLNAGNIQAKSAYCVASDVISGVSPRLAIVEKIENGRVTLKPEIEGLPMGAVPGGCWMKRARGTEDWSWMQMNQNLLCSVGLFVYSEEEYRFVYTQSQALIDTMPVGDVVAEGGRGYLVSGIFTGKDYRIGDVTADFCTLPGKVVQNIDFSSEYPANVEIHGRWMQKEKDGGAWNWMSNVVYGLPDFEVAMSDYLTHDYRLILSWSRDSLRGWQAGSLPSVADEYRIGGETREQPVCIQIDTIRAFSVAKGGFELRPEVSCDKGTSLLYGRWLKAAAGTDGWEWVGEAVSGTGNLSLTAKELEENDFRYVTAFDGGLPADAGHIAGRSYFAEDTFRNVKVLRPSLFGRQVQCVADRDSNRVELSFACPEGITALTYRIGNGEVKTDSVGGESGITFGVAADEVFHLLYYAQRGFCDRILQEDTVRITYRPRAVVSGMTDVFACVNNDVVIAPKVTGKGMLARSWFRDGEEEPFSLQDTLKMSVSHSDTLEIRLVVGGEQVCPTESRVHVISADYPEMIRGEEVNRICVGAPFRLNYLSTTAEEYRIVLKQSTMPGFTLYSATSEIREKENGALEIFSGQAPLYATEFMAGHRFVFQVQVFRYIEFNGISYRCDREFETVFEVAPKPSSGYIGDINACMNEILDLNPEVQSNGNPVAEYVWRLWDSDSVRTDSVLSRSATESGLHAVVGERWIGRRLQLVTMCDCGEVVVQDIPLSIFDNSRNTVSAPAGILLAGESVRIEGSEMKAEGIKFLWEYKTDGEGWNILPGEEGFSLDLRAPEVPAVYRRRIVSDVYRCEGRLSDSVRLDVYNNGLENRISVAPADTLVSAGTSVAVNARKSRDGVEFVWQKNDAGQWEDVVSENAGKFEFTAGEMTMIRRKAIVGENEMFSNVVLVNVYDAGKNKIMAPLSIIFPGEKAYVIGNYFNLPGVTYGWWMNRESSDVWERMPGADSWDLESGCPETALYMRCVYLPTGDTLKSNQVRVTVFDNTRDNVINAPGLNVCKSEVIQISGKEIGGPETVYRWECSFDRGESWEVVDGENGASLAFHAEKSSLLRRFVVAGKLEDSFSNVLDVNVVHGADDNVIAFTGIILSGQPAEIRGNEVKNAVYSWEQSSDGQIGWQVITGAKGSSLSLGAAQTAEASYFRRWLKFEDSGCEMVSSVLKMVIMDDRRNAISGPGEPVCQWSGFTLTGEDLEDVDAKYLWFCDRGKGWTACEYAFEKDLKIYEGLGNNAAFRRDVTVDGKVYQSNVVNVAVRNGNQVNNSVAQPGLVCAGGEVTLKGSDLSSPEWSGYVQEFYWEKSATAIGGTWARVDSAGAGDLVLKNVRNPEWYCRVVATACGEALRSEPILLEVKEHLPLTLRNNVTFGEMKVKEPVRISVDEDFYNSYEFKIDGEVRPSSGNEYQFYGWTPKKEYQVIVNVVSPQGCRQADTMRLRTSDVDLPNVLTPNDDGYNDVLLADYDLRVYNRWGNLLFEGTEGWDGRYKGRTVAPGTYFYVVRIKQQGGNVSEYRRSVTIKK